MFCSSQRVTSIAAITFLLHCYILTVSYITLAVSDRHMNHGQFHSKCDLYGSSADSVIVLLMRATARVIALPVNGSPGLPGAVKRPAIDQRQG